MKLRDLIHYVLLVRLSRAFLLYENGDREAVEDDYTREVSRNVSDVLDGFFINTGYDKRIRPFYRGEPIQVLVSVWIQDVSAISEVDMDFTLDFYFRQKWVDPRLKFTSEYGELSIGAEMTDKIWRPDTFFVNAKRASFHDATAKNTFIRVNPSGNVFISTRLTVTASCHMDLTYFPMDSQMCTLEIESFGYTDKDIIYKWLDWPQKSVGIDSKVQLPQFKVGYWRECNKTINLTTGVYSRLAVEIFFHRSMGYYLIQIYVPSILIVVLSWVSFWLSREAVPARVALGITTVLTMTTLISSTNASLPKISYLKSIDVYLVTCFIMVFASLLEYAAVSYITKRCGKNRARYRHRSESSRYWNYWTSSDEAEPGYMTCCLEDPPATESLVGRDEATRQRMSSYSPQQRLSLNTKSNASGERRPTTAAVAPEIGLRQTSLRHEDPNYSPSPIQRTTLRQRHTSRERNSISPANNDSLCVIQCMSVKGSMIDRRSRLIFPAIFIIFNIMYWVTYVNISAQSNMRQMTQNREHVTCIGQ